MKITYYKVNPGGNITAIVLGKFTKKIKLKINNSILKNEPTIEQVGFWVNPINKKNNARLEMAGGEFCGNAIRSLGSILTSNNKNKLYTIESSGFKIPLKLISLNKYSSVSINLNLFKYNNDICTIPGIKHFLTENKYSKIGAREILKKQKLLLDKAAGVITYKKIGKSTYKIKPIVWVKDTKTLYEETACASGTFALAYKLYKEFDIKNLKIKQPSGFVFKTIISNNKITLGGPIISIKKNMIND